MADTLNPGVSDTSQNAKVSEKYTSRPWLTYYSDYVPADLTPPFKNALAMFLHTAKAVPEQAAIYYFDATYTYGELDRQSSALAAALQEKGIGQGDRVAVYLQNVPQFPLAMYAIWKAGGIMVLCNPMFKQKELDYHLSDSGAKALICLESLYETVARATVGATKVQTVITTNELDYLGSSPVPAMLQGSKKQRFEETLDLIELVKSHDGRTIEPPDFAPGDVAFLTYTSGTTGKPKGAMNTHRNVVFNSQVYKTWMQLERNDVVIGMAPFFHITGLIAHLTVAALAGIPVITFYRFDSAEMLRLTEKWQGSFTVASITAFSALLDHPDVRKRDLSSMTKIYSGGAPVSPTIVENFEKATGVYIYNAYGLTETTSPSHLGPRGKKAPVDADSGALSIGVPVPNTICRIIDVATGVDLPPGEIGELITTGPEVVAGYWEKPEETANAIRDGYLYTGDVAKMDKDGWFYIVDRKKDMIVVSGYKVWPRDVEDTLYQHPAVREAAVVGIPDPYSVERVKAYVALKRGFEGTVTPEELTAFCKERIATYKAPREVEIMDDLPKTTTGKYLRRELRDKARASTSTDNGGKQPGA